MNEFIPIYEYANLYGLDRQTVYRYIREGKIKKSDFRIEEKTVKRLKIRRDLHLITSKQQKKLE